MLNHLKKYTIKAIKSIIPTTTFDTLQRKKYQKRDKKFQEQLKSQILKYYKNNVDPEIEEVIQFLRNNPISVFPYPYIENYKKDDIKVYEDEKTHLKYVIHEHKRLYFKRSMSDHSIKSLYSGLQIDQDERSPHLYLTSDFNLSENDVIADIGAAEGNFSLSNIEKVKKAYLFESNPEWIEALEATFEPWKHKVTIINSFVTDYDSDTTLNINTFYRDHSDISFFKVDIEGEEQHFLNSCSSLFKANNAIKIAICTYHKHNDEKDFKLQLNNLGFEVEHSDGFMLYFYDKDIKPPYIRRGLLRAKKQISND